MAPKGKMLALEFRMLGREEGAVQESQESTKLAARRSDFWSFLLQFVHLANE